jgi:hypothetical protein
VALLVVPPPDGAAGVTLEVDELAPVPALLLAATPQA